MKELTDAIFEKEVLKAENLVMVDFWAPWCGPCKMMEPIIDALAVEFGDKPVGVMKLNVDENPKKSEEYSVMSIHSVKMFKNGKIVAEFVGAQPESQIKIWLDRNI